MASQLRASRVPIIAIYLLLLGLFLVVFLHSFAGTAQAANPNLMNFQGKVVNADGTNVANNSYTFRFCLYTTATPATPCTGAADNDAIWRESKSLSTSSSIFQTNLGDVTTLPNFNTYPTLYLGVNFNADAAGEMTPRIRLTSAPYALNSDALSGLAAGNFVQLAQGIQADASTTNASIGINKTGSTANILQLQKAGNNVFVVENGGTVILGTSSTSSAINFAGSGNVAGTIRKTMPITGTVAANDVVVIDTATGGNVTTTTTASDPKVYGIATTTTTPQEIVTSGTFQVNLLATNAAISPGDFLVTTTTAGRVDKSTSPAAGTVLGRALETKGASAGGTIWVSVTPGIGGTGGGGGTLATTYNSTGTSGNTIVLASAGGGVLIQDAATTVGGNLFAVQENTANGSADLFAVSTIGLMVEHLSGNDALLFDTTTSTAHLRIYGSDGVKHADIYYDNATSTAYYGASSGTAVLGSGTGAVNVTAGAGAAFTITGNAASSITTSAGNLSLQGGSGTVQIASSVLSGSGALTVQSGGATALTVTSGAALVIDAAAASSIRIGDATNNLTLAATTREPVLAGTARHTRYIMLAAEFPGAVMTGDGTNNTGTMTSDSETSSPYNSYYNWTSTGANDYDIWIKVPLPEDWAAWSGSGGTATGFGTAADEGVTIEFFGTNNTTICSSDIVTAVGWNNNIATCNYTAGTFATSGNFFTIRVKLAVSASGDNARIANIKLPYLSKW